MKKSNPSISHSPEVVVVQASAGSGKTYALAKRFLSILIGPAIDSGHIPLRNILAITFTNKATVEMKERILDFLKKIALNAFDSAAERQDICALLSVDEAAAQSKALRIMEELVNHYNFFQVQTIDSFINSLLLGCAFKLDRSSRFRIKRDYSEYLSYCLDRTIEEASSDPEVLRLLEEFLEHYLFVEHRMGWFPKEDILGLMQSLFTLSNKYGTTLMAYRGKSSDIIKKKRYIHSLITALYSQAPEGLNANAYRSLGSFLAKSKDIFDVADLPATLQKDEPPMNKKLPAPAAFARSWRKVHNELIQLIEFDASMAYNPYIKLFGRLIRFFREVTRDEDVVFLEELNRKARLLFDEESISVAEIYYRLATRFRHFLIDEFQDTSVLQWQNLYPMVEEALSCGGTLFYVGDKKQAIYRFRG